MIYKHPRHPVVLILSSTNNIFLHACSLCNCSVKWDEEKLSISEAIKMTIPTGQIDEPKTPYQYGQYGSSKLTDCELFIFTIVGCEESGDEVNFNLKDDKGELSDSEGEYNDSSRSNDHMEESCESVSGGWESSVSEFEDDGSRGRERNEKFKAIRAQHYFMKQAIQHGKELIESEDEEEDEETEK